MICFPEQTAGPLMHRGYCLFRKRIVFESGDIQVMLQISFHALTVDGLEMGAGNDPGRQGDGGTIEQVVGQVVLPGQDDGQPRF